METIQEIRRINELSKILKSHGFAQDSLSATNNAREIATKVSKEQSILKSEPVVKQGENSRNYDQLLVKINNLENAKHKMLETISLLQQEVETLKRRLDSVSVRPISIPSTLNNTNRGEDSQQPPVTMEIAGGGRPRDPGKAKLPTGYTLDKLFSADK